MDLSPDSIYTDRLPGSKRDLFGVGVNPTTYDQVVQLAMSRASHGEPAIVDFMPVHGLIVAARHRHFREAIDAFDVVAPDGQPVRWALNLFHKTHLDDRVYGPTCMMRLCEAAAQAGISIYLYGATTEVIAALETNLRERFPNIVIAGSESPPFRDLTDEEVDKTVDRINGSGAGLLFIGLGCPKQEMFAFEHRARMRPVQLCVGAAFDFHAGTKRMAPPWMQRNGLEWLFRLFQEPRRLFRRYAVNNTMYLGLVARELVTRGIRRVSR